MRERDKGKNGANKTMAIKNYILFRAGSENREEEKNSHFAKAETKWIPKYAN